MNTTPTLVSKTTGLATSPRPKATDVCAHGIAGGIDRSAWLVVTRTSMTVPAFHDRWPLCSST